MKSTLFRADWLASKIANSVNGDQNVLSHVEELSQMAYQQSDSLLAAYAEDLLSGLHKKKSPQKLNKRKNKKGLRQTDPKADR